MAGWLTDRLNLQDGAVADTVVSCTVVQCAPPAYKLLAVSAGLLVTGGWQGIVATWSHTHQMLTRLHYYYWDGSDTSVQQ
jgi:hypothetical protein